MISLLFCGDFFCQELTVGKWSIQRQRINHSQPAKWCDDYYLQMWGKKSGGVFFQPFQFRKESDLTSFRRATLQEWLIKWALTREDRGLTVTSAHWDGGEEGDWASSLVWTALPALQKSMKREDFPACQTQLEQDSIPQASFHFVALSLYTNYIWSLWKSITYQQRLSSKDRTTEV